MSTDPRVMPTDGNTFTSPVGNDYASTTRELLIRWRNRVRTNQLVHYERARQLERLHFFFGAPSVAISAIVGTSVFATLADNANVWGKLLVAAGSLLAATFTALLTFFNCADGAGKHHAVGAAYGAIHRRIEVELSKAEDPAHEFLEGLRSELDQLPLSAPGIPKRMWKKIDRELTPGVP